MLSLDSPRWAELDHAYGKADDVPALLRQLESLPSGDGDSEPWFSIWSALAHQGDVYSASFAAVPHVVQYLASDPTIAGHTYLLFPAWVEICRQRLSAPVPSDLEEAYLSALNQLPSLAVAALCQKRDETFVRCALAAIAAANCQTALAAVILELEPDVADGFREWLENR